MGKDVSFFLPPPAQEGDAAGALARIGERRALDLLITDVGLPGMNGRQMADAVMQVLTAAQGQNPARQAALAGGLPDTVSAPLAGNSIATTFGGAEGDVEQRDIRGGEDGEVVGHL